MCDMTLKKKKISALYNSFLTAFCNDLLCDVSGKL